MERKKDYIIMTHYSMEKKEKPELGAKIVATVFTVIIIGLVAYAFYLIVTGK